MIKDFGIFNLVTTQIKEGDGYPDELIGAFLSRSISEDGDDWIDIYSAFSTFNGPFFISSEYAYYAVVEADGRIRMSYRDPSAVGINSGDRIIASDEPFTIEDIYDFETGEIYTPEIVQTYFVRAGDLWDRVTDEEAEAIEEAIDAQPVRVRNIFRTRTEYHSDHELFPLLTRIAETLFGKDRAAEILRPSV
ncbi:hypothetical protein [Aureimonas altamirensis]|uniref:hypothetical protein n=1 Tax=Aureimonas altamirensis TaxID=370622 RepID=UPI003016491F